MADGKRDYYEILGLERGAGEADIKKAFRTLARQHHPDANPGDPTAEEKFKEINEAYSVLSDAEKRARYDRFGHAGVGPGSSSSNAGADPFGFSDLFEAFFGGAGFPGGGQGRRTRVAEAGADIRYDLELTLNEAATGVERHIEFQRVDSCPICDGTGAKPGSKPAACPQCGGTGQVRQVQSTPFGRFVNVRTCDKCGGKGTIVTEPCPDCKGSGKLRRVRQLDVKVPAGVDTESRLRVSGEGHAGENGGPPGDLYCFIHVQPHPDFTRDGNELRLKRTISMTQAALGTELTVPTLDGDQKLRIPPGTQSGAVFRLKGKGMPDVRGFGRGDEHIQIVVEIPNRLNERQKELLREFAEIAGQRVDEPPKGFFRRR